MNSDHINKSENIEVNVNSKLMLVIVVLLGIISYTLGYIVSSNTGVEPGFFEIAESGGYGVAAENKPTEGMSEDVQNYYDQLAEEN